VRFGGGADALELLARVYRARGEVELADRALARADQARKSRENAASSPGEEGKDSS
jgi:hypothetical protein